MILDSSLYCINVLQAIQTIIRSEWIDLWRVRDHHITNIDKSETNLGVLFYDLNDCRLFYFFKFTAITALSKNICCQ